MLLKGLMKLPALVGRSQLEGEDPRHSTAPYTDLGIGWGNTGITRLDSTRVPPD
jgi:hypothetical protein